MRAAEIPGRFTETDHYDGSADSPSVIGTASGWTRNLEGIDGNLAATITNTGAVTYQLTNLHGDITATADAGGPTAYFEYTEFGVPRTDNSSTPDRYGWLGGKERSAHALGGVVLMGVRLYNTGTGRFLQLDPVPGGSANSYDYANQDPLNQLDLKGEFSIRKWWKRHHRGLGRWIGRYAGYGAYLPGDVGLAFQGISIAGYATAGDWRQVRVGSVNMLAGVGGRYFSRRLNGLIWRHGGSRVLRRRVQRYHAGFQFARGLAYNTMMG